MSEPQPVHEMWGIPLNVFYCSHCHSAHLAPSAVTLSVCPACLQGEVSAQPERLRREPPELVIPFVVDGERARDALTRWAKGGLFRPDDLHPEALVGRTRTYYFPVWLVDSSVKAVWRAEMGYDYQAASYREQYRQGRWVSEQITETRTRWEPRVGRLNRDYENVAVPAMEEHDLWMTRLGGYDYRTRTGYAPHAVEGSVVRVPDLDPEAAWPHAEYMLNRTASVECKSASEADHVRNWAMDARYDHLAWTQMLVPSYVTYYAEGDGVYPVWINGQSGTVYGVRRVSQRKATMASLITGGAAALLFLFGLITALVGAALVLPMAIGVVLVVMGVVFGLLAPVPAIWAWFKNRGHGT